jgi:hypothetical protein
VPSQIYQCKLAVAAVENSLRRWHSVAGTQQIADWLKKLGMSEYIDRFAENRIEDLIVRMAKENQSWGYDWIVGALAAATPDQPAADSGADMPNAGSRCRGAISGARRRAWKRSDETEADPSEDLGGNLTQPPKRSGAAN